MVSDCITYQNSGYFSKLINDYLNENDTLRTLYNRFPTIENFGLQIEEKQRQFPLKNRIALKEQLQQQYQNFSISDSTQLNINLLEKENTFTVTTGHQLNLFTGPIYFIYKIVATIKLCKQLKAAYPDFNFVPVYWMATEDHDFEEINHFIYKGKKISWNKNSKGPVGRLTNEGLDKVFEEFSNMLPSSLAANDLQKLFTVAYLQHDNLAEATRFLVNELFKNYGLVIVDGDDKKLKE